MGTLSPAEEVSQSIILALAGRIKLLLGISLPLPLLTSLHPLGITQTGGVSQISLWRV
jgi:hypothetical protein